VKLKKINPARTYFITLLGLLIFALNPITQAGIEARQFTDPAQERRYHKIVDEMRCLVCQNQNLSDSNAKLALDLRDKIYGMVKDNQTDQQIADYMVNRYGKFILYNPPLDPVTSFLWLGPLILVIAAVILLLFNIKTRSNARPVEISAEDHKRSQKLLEDEDKIS